MAGDATTSEVGSACSLRFSRAPGLDTSLVQPGAVKRKFEDKFVAQPYDHIDAICGANYFDDWSRSWR